MAKGDESPVKTVDLSKEVCPVAYVCAAIALEKIQDGELVEFILGDEEAARDVPRSLENDGHLVERMTPKDGRHAILVRKNGAPTPKEKQ